MFAWAKTAAAQGERPLKSIHSLQDHGYADGIVSKLSTDANIGVVGDRKDLARRRQVFGTNTRPRPRLPTLCGSIREQLGQCLWWVVAVTALLTGVCGFFSVKGTAALGEGA